MIRIRAVRSLALFCVQLTFTDGTERTVDLSPYLVGPIFEPLKTDPDLFRSVKVDDQLGTIVWPNGADLCPDVLYQAGLTKSQEVPREARG